MKRRELKAGYAIPSSCCPFFSFVHNVRSFGRGRAVISFYCDWERFLTFLRVRAWHRALSDEIAQEWKKHVEEKKSIATFMPAFVHVTLFLFFLYELRRPVVVLGMHL
jgi:hypothetical protein